MDELDFLDRSPGKTLETYAEALAEYTRRVNRLEEKAEQYRGTVDAYREGRADPVTLKQEMRDIAEELDEIEEFSLGLFEKDVAAPSVEPAEEDTPAYLQENGFTVLSQVPLPRRIVPALTEAEIAYQTFLEMGGEPAGDSDDITRLEEFSQIKEETQDAFEQMRDDIMEYEMEFLQETLDMTVAGVMLDNMDAYERAQIDQMFNQGDRKHVMQNPNDTYLGYVASEDGTEDFETAREA
ncbi:MAG: hypothetical protein SVW02_00400, partial [Candidatus Nanohaloarchaea archaeon]|nr:hypothetical protein [Candidatus Nanohaloarchaea archaeon]